jgi:activator of HSP90 ATPase
MKQTGSTWNLKGTSGKKGNIKHYNKNFEGLKAEREELVEKKETEGVLTTDEEARLAKLERDVNMYAAAMNQVNVNPTPESSAAAQQHATEQHATEQHATSHDATEANAAAQNATEENAADQNATVNAPDPVTKHVNAQESPSKHRGIKRESAEELKLTTNRFVDDLGIA